MSGWSASSSSQFSARKWKIRSQCDCEPPSAEFQMHASLLKSAAQRHLTSTPVLDYLYVQGGGPNTHEKECPSPAEVETTSICTTCHDKISDRFLLQVNGLQYHTDCLRCSACGIGLQSEPSCFFRDGQVYCRNDYYRSFGTKCSKCTRWICSTDWVRRARDSASLMEQVYHLACFVCDACKRQLSTGEEFALMDSKILCKTHYQESIDGPSDDSDDSNGDGDPNHSGSKSKTKRVRTTFTDEQLQILQANFHIDSNPDGQDLERIAQITGLSKRVTQVWFQNSRARQKKHNNNKKGSTNQNFQRQINLRLTTTYGDL